MMSSLIWVHIGDLHMDEENGSDSRGRLAEISTHIRNATDLVYLPGDNAHHATVEQFRVITDTLTPLPLPYCVIPGDHDFERGDLADYEAAFPEAYRLEAELVAGHRCICLDVIPAGAGGPDLRLTMHHRSRRREEFARAQAGGRTSVVFMHAYPDDLAVDGEDIARALADADVAFVDTGFWKARVPLGAGLLTVEVAVGIDRDVIDMPGHGMPIAPGHDIQGIGSWPEHGIEASRLGLNKNGKHW